MKFLIHFGIRHSLTKNIACDIQSQAWCREGWFNKC